MKNLKKIVSVVCILAMLCVGIVFAALATDDDTGYTGTVEELNTLIADVEAADGNAFDSALEAAVEYLNANTFDPDDANLSVAVATLKTLVLERAVFYVHEAGNSNYDLGERVSYIIKSDDIIALIDFAEEPEEPEEPEEDVEPEEPEEDVEPIDDEYVPFTYEEYLELVDEIVLELAADCYAEIKYVLGEDGYYNTTANAINVNRINYLVKNHPLNLELEGAEEFMASYETLAQQHEVYKTANKARAEEGIALDQYALSSFINADFSNSLSPFTNPSNPDPANFAGIKHGALNVTYHETATDYHKDNVLATNTYWQTSVESKAGLVVEFDFMTEDKMPSNPSDGFSVEGGGTTPVDGGDKVYPHYMMISKDGDICYIDKSTSASGVKNVLVEDAIVRGEWLRFAVVYDPFDFTFSLYCEYEHLATYDARAAGKQYELVVARFTARGMSGEWSIDNLNVYAGTQIRTLNRLQNMSQEEKFVFYCSYLDEQNDIITRKNAYDEVGALIGSYWDAEAGELDEEGNPTGDFTKKFKEMEEGEMKEAVRSAVETYLTFDYEAIVKYVSELNRDEFISMVDELGKIERSPDTVSNRADALTKISDFLIGCNGMITMDADYAVANNTLQALDKVINTDKNIETFNRNMERFGMVDTLVAKQKYYNLAKALYDDETYPINANTYNAIKNDETLSGEFATFLQRFEEYLNSAEAVAALQREENSKMIIACVDFISVYTTEEEWLDPANYNYINRYILLLRDTVKPNEDGSLKYDENYEGIDEALETLAPIENFFYNHLQQSHIKEIRDTLEYIAATDSYIEKMGMCAYITRYLAENDIDFDNSEIKQLIIGHETYLEELEYREADYEMLLVQNAHYFSQLVKKMEITDSYTEKLELFNQATEYYFALDASVADAAEMIQIYDAQAEQFRLIQSSTAQFILSVDMLRAAEGDDAVYAELVRSYGYSKNVETSIDGAAEAMEYFLGVYNEYVEYSSSMNDEIHAAATAVANVRANTNIASVIVGILKIVFGM